MRRSIPCLALSLLVAGCASRFERPTVQVRSVAVRGVSLDGADVHVGLGMYNPNTRELPIRTIDFQLTVGASEPMPGHGELSEALPPLATTPVAVVVRVSPAAAVSAVGELARGRTDYRIDGQVTARSWIGDVQVPFDEQGDLLE